jgi:hypothetical protein
VQASWAESGLGLSASGLGLTEQELASVLDASELDEGVVVGAPAGWSVLGGGRSIGGFDSTIIGFASAGEGLDEVGVAALELSIADPADGTPGTGAPEVIGEDLRLSSADDRPALLGSFGGSTNVVSTTTGEGHGVRVQGDVDHPTLLEASRDLRRIDAADPVLAGVPMGNGNSSGGWCREDL